MVSHPSILHRLRLPLTDADQPPTAVHLAGHELPGKLSGFEEVVARYPNALRLSMVGTVHTLSDVELAQDLEPIALANLL